MSPLKHFYFHHRCVGYAFQIFEDLDLLVGRWSVGHGRSASWCLPHIVSPPPPTPPQDKRSSNLALEGARRNNFL